jgi:RNA polymerase sigma-70 factor (ECF subfamily)
VSETLIRKARQGDADAFTALCAPLENMVYRHCLQMLHNPMDAQDATQEAMLRAYRSFPKFQGMSGVATWLFRIAHNVCLDFLKRPLTKREGTSLDALQQEGFDKPDPNPNPEDSYLTQSERELLLSAVARLPDEQKALLSLRYGDGLSYDTLAQTLGLNPGTVKSKLNRAKERLRQLLPESYLR